LSSSGAFNNCDPSTFGRGELGARDWEVVKYSLLRLAIPLSMLCGDSRSSVIDRVRIFLVRPVVDVRVLVKEDDINDTSAQSAARLNSVGVSASTPPLPTPVVCVRFTDIFTDQRRQLYAN
jgi:hypothetical protein